MHPITKFIRSLFRRSTNVVAIVDEEKVARYVEAGGRFGSAVSYIYMGECVGFEDLLKNWEHAEADYAAMGYRTLTLDDFVDFGGWNKEITTLRTPREIGEEPIYHAVFYRENLLGKVEPMFDFNKMMKDGQPQAGNYAVPSTKHLKGK